MFIKITFFVAALLLAQILCVMTYKFAYKHTVVFLGLNERPPDTTQAMVRTALVNRTQPIDEDDDEFLEYVSAKQPSAMRNIYYIFCFIWLLTGFYYLQEYLQGRKMQNNQNNQSNTFR